MYWLLRDCSVVYADRRPRHAVECQAALESPDELDELAEYITGETEDMVYERAGIDLYLQDERMS